QQEVLKERLRSSEHPDCSECAFQSSAMNVAIGSRRSMTGDLTPAFPEKIFLHETTMDRQVRRNR
ncbi:MAG: hypothetical protein ACK58T_32430, partial [Phycisphaerae bacterium]